MKRTITEKIDCYEICNAEIGQAIKFLTKLAGKLKKKGFNDIRLEIDGDYSEFTCKVTADKLETSVEEAKREECELFAKRILLEAEKTKAERALEGIISQLKNHKED